MIHYFDTEVAKVYGVHAAVILQNLAHWIAHNEANGTNFYDGNYWTYNSKKAFSELFPYLTEKQIRTAIEKLIDAGLVVTGNYNKYAYDRTLWYALTEKGKCICLQWQMEMPKKANGNATEGEPIPNINTDNKPVEKQKEIKKATAGGYDSIIAEYTENDALKQALLEFIKMRKFIKKPLTDRAFRLVLSNIDKLAKTDAAKIEILNQSIMNCWQGVFPLRNNNSGGRQAPQQRQPDTEPDPFWDMVEGS